mmetsp:Transcript_9839/g.13575  ORF Transcript_9839/g.13575 Transcript_9839/m.13575 type:complete len:206 (-) Transcript_9839:282-899(-)
MSATESSSSSSYSSSNSATAFPPVAVKKEKSGHHENPPPFPSHLAPPSTLDANEKSIDGKEEGRSYHHPRLRDDSDDSDDGQDESKDADGDDGGGRKAYGAPCQQQQDSSGATKSIFSSNITGNNGKKQGSIFMILNGIELIYQRMEERFMQLERKFSSVEGRLRNMDRRLGRMESTSSSTYFQHPQIHRERGGEGSYKGRSTKR